MHLLKVTSRTHLSCFDALFSACIGTLRSFAEHEIISPFVFEWPQSFFVEGYQSVLLYFFAPKLEAVLSS